MTDEPRYDAPTEPAGGGFASPSSPTEQSAPDAAPAGWYPDPSDASFQRWWNGAAWTEHRTANGTAQASSVAGAAPRRKRMSTPVIAGLVVGGLILGGGAVRGIALAAGTVMSSLAAEASADGAGSADSTGGADATDPSESPANPIVDTAPEPPPTLPDGWARTSILKGGGTVAYKAEWEDISDLAGTDEIEQEAWDNWGIELTIDGAWKTGGDVDTGYTSIYVESVVDVGGPSSARLEAQGLFESETTGIDDVDITSERPVTTPHGASGYVIEYQFPYYDELLTSSVAVLVQGTSQVVIYVYGSERLGTGTTELATMLDTIWIN